MATTTRTDEDLAAALSVAVAIGVFGVVYGATAAPQLGTATTVLSSALVFSGAGQFSMVALLAAGAGPLAALGATVPLALRHLPLGAVLRPHLTAGPARRAALSWFLIDETTGLALARPDRVERTLTVAGGLAYGAWVVGTAAGVGGAALPAVEPLAGALFPVLFIGLAAVTSAGADGAGRAVLAGVAALVLLVLWPGAGVLGAIAVAVGVALPGATR
ncbi:AzlC family ABC transporter permease [Dermatobacter hominis]|uniref:AzlC family ABC transporter permease n=1 Tax=Dermatobacter hominis TaxID=2884263 RepID=UPI001D12D801|nr:AzlC family ABC transporter permease [Dermatobacter hominis]UDY35096.1 AzlC family ABC transporter permease [Dermatobacter hominis]